MSLNLEAAEKGSKDQRTGGFMEHRYPERIVCLSGESADICHRLGAGDRVVGLSAFAPKAMHAGRAIVGGFSTLNMADLLSLEPDLVITFSDVQAQISADLIRNHCTVLATNQRSLRGIVQVILLIGRVIGCAAEAEKLASDFDRQLGNFRCDEQPRPRVYFEEWDEPLITGIGWVSEAIFLVGGKDVFSLPNAKASLERRVEAAAVCRADPQIIFVSWCGKPVDPGKIAERPGWCSIAAIRDKNIYSINSEDILQPGPGVLAGVSQMAEIIERWRRQASSVSYP
ncbi:MAG: ABC transporter substrate-binding protein [Verrucomicrobia bacterium]|nr:ABC transporter substrate-binding protein [Verrucomicrobiota bacterium]